MILRILLVAAAVMSVAGGWLGRRDPRTWRRATSLASAVASIASELSFLRLLQVYNSRPLALVEATHNPLAGLGPWDLLAPLLSFIAIIAAVLGAGKARLLLIPPALVMFGITVLAMIAID